MCSPPRVRASLSRDSATKFKSQYLFVKIQIQWTDLRIPHFPVATSVVVSDVAVSNCDVAEWSMINSFLQLSGVTFISIRECVIIRELAQLRHLK